MLSIHDVGIRLGSFSIRNLSMLVEEGEYLVVLGMSGVGKTVLLEILAGLLVPDQGKITMDGVDITFQKIQKRSIRLVYQDQALFPHLSVFKNLAYGLHSQDIPARQRKKQVDQVASRLGINHLLDRLPETLSGGEAQRVALGRALVTDPRLLLLDEPLSALDPQSRADIQALLRTLHRQHQTIIHVTHDYEEAVSLASRIVILEDGLIVQSGTPEEIFRQPRSKFVARFVGIRNYIDGELASGREQDREISLFQTGAGIQFQLVTDHPDGHGYCMIRSEDITLSNHADETSALNHFNGRIVDMIRSMSGVEVIVDIGLNLSAIVTQDSVKRLRFEIGKDVHISFKATAIKFVPRDSK